MAETREPAETGQTVEVAELQVVEPARNAPLILLAIFATIFILEWAQAVFIPLFLGLIVSYALAPVVDRLERHAVPRGLSAAVLLLAIVTGLGASAYALRDEATNLIETLPEAVQKIQQSMQKELVGPGETIQKVQRAAREIERATQGGGAAQAPS